MAEKAAWDFAKEEGLDVVVVNPGTVMGPVISPRLNASMLMLVRLLQGNLNRNNDLCSICNSHEFSYFCPGILRLSGDILLVNHCAPYV